MIYLKQHMIENHGQFSILPKGNNNYWISLQDSGTNFAGGFGINSFFKGDSASNIQMSDYIRDDKYADRIRPNTKTNLWRL